MNNKTKILKELFAKGFIRLPRKVVNNMYSEKSFTRNKSRVYAALLILAHPKTFVDYDYDPPLTFNPGDFLISRRDLAALTDVIDSNVTRCIKKLEEDGLITTHWKEGKTLFHVNYYEEITHHYVEIDTGQDRTSTGSRKQTKSTASDTERMTPTEKKLFEASARAYKRAMELQKEEQK